MDFYPIGGVPRGYEQITSLGSAAALTVPAGAKTAVISVAGAPIRIRDDGVDPTATVGFPFAVGEQFVYYGNPSTLRFIEQSASAALDVLYY